MMRTIIFGWLLLLAWAAQAADIRVDDAWARATVPGQQVASVFMTITSAQAAQWVGVHTDVAGQAQLHSLSMENGVMRMRAVAQIDLPAGQPVKLGPGGLHVMLLDLHHPLHAGDVVPLQLDIETADHQHQQVAVQAVVRDMSASALLPAK